MIHLIEYHAAIKNGIYKGFLMIWGNAEDRLQNCSYGQISAVPPPTERIYIKMFIFKHS